MCHFDGLGLVSEEWKERQAAWANGKLSVNDDVLIDPVRFWYEAADHGPVEATLIHDPRQGYPEGETTFRIEVIRKIRK